MTTPVSYAGELGASPGPHLYQSGEMADTHALGACAARREGSTPFSGTRSVRENSRSVARIPVRSRLRCEHGMATCP